MPTRRLPACRRGRASSGAPARRRAFQRRRAARDRGSPHDGGAGDPPLDVLRPDLAPSVALRSSPCARASDRRSIRGRGDVRRPSLGRLGRPGTRAPLGHARARARLSPNRRRRCHRPKRSSSCPLVPAEPHGAALPASNPPPRFTPGGGAQFRPPPPKTVSSSSLRAATPAASGSQPRVSSATAAPRCKCTAASARGARDAPRRRRSRRRPPSSAGRLEPHRNQRSAHPDPLADARRSSATPSRRSCGSRRRHHFRRS